jgi:hypothetical protein
MIAETGGEDVGNEYYCMRRNEPVRGFIMSWRLVSP